MPTIPTEPHIAVLVRFLTSSEGGRTRDIDIRQNERYGCVLIVNGLNLEARFFVKEARFHLGEEYQIPLLLLNFRSYADALSLSSPVEFWEGKVIARGRLVSIAR